jgi:ABC-type branched-subunit amino acid transport system substrate-binding protein
VVSRARSAGSCHARRAAVEPVLEDSGPGPPEVTVLGGPAEGAAAPAVEAPPVLRRLLVGLAAVAVLVAAVLGQRSERAPTTSECPEPCLAPDALVLGTALPVSGVLAPLGAAQQRGVQRELDRVNAAGGVEVAGQRRRVELLVRDTRSLPDEAGQAALILVRGPFRPIALIGPCTPPVPMARVAESREVPLVTGCQPLPPVGPAPPRHTWEVAPTEDERARAVFAALRTSPSRRVGLFLSNDRSEAPWTTAGRRAGFDVVGTYRPLGQDWSSAVGQAAAADVEVVVAVTQPPAGIGLWRTLRAQGVEPRSAYASEAGLASAWYAAVGRDGDGTLTDVVHPSLSGRAAPAAVDDAVAAVSTELTRVLLDGLRRTTTEQRPALDAALAGVRTQVAGRQVRFLGDRASRLPVRLGRWEGGRLVPLDAVGP